MIVEYIGDEPLTLAEVKLHCRIDGADEDGLISSIIIPGARAMAESKTGTAIREARYRHDVPDLGAAVLPVGGVIEVLSVTAGGEPVGPYETATIAGRTTVSAQSHARRPGQITYRAGTDIAKYPSVKSWMLLAAGWLYANRELLVIGQPVKEMPQRYVDTLLHPIDLHAAL